MKTVQNIASLAASCAKPNRTLVGLLSLLACVALPSLPASAQTSATVVAKVTADNAYALYYGSRTQATISVGTAANSTAGAIYGIETYTTPNVAHDGYAYVAAWSDDAGAQGLLASLTVNGRTVSTGDGRWEVYATGLNKNTGDAAPTLTELNAQIALANANGWQAPFAGQGNLSGPVYSAVPGLEAYASWIWHSKAGCAQNGNGPLTPGCNHDEYLIFRLPIWTMGCTGNFDLDLSTGVLNGTQQASASQDTRWFNATNSQWLTVVNPVAGWGSSSYAKWLSPTTSGANATTHPAQTDHYRIKFDLEPASVQNLQILVQELAVDNHAWATLNGNTTTGFSRAGSGGSNFSSLTGPYTVTGPFQPGTNVFNVQVQNDGGPEGLLLKGKVSGQCVTGCANECPYIGSYDSRNCWVGQAPAGTTAFIWGNNFYYTPINGNQCPLAGSGFDGYNCYVATIPPGARPFIYSNMWYITPSCQKPLG